MIRLLSKFLGLLFIVALVANVFVYQQSHKWLVVSWIAYFQNTSLAGITTDLTHVSHKLAEGHVPEAKAEKVKIYKWTDAKGIVHYDNQPVANAKIMEVNPDANVLTLEKIETVSGAEQSSASTTKDELRAIQEAKKAQMESVIDQ